MQPSAPASGRRMQPGFTLIELLVALVILATAGIIVSSSVSNIAAQTYSLERRQIAHWIAEDHLTRMRITRRGSDAELPAGRDVTRVDAADRRWELRSEVKSTAHPLVQRMDVSVFELVGDGKAEGPLDQQSAFLGRY